MSFNVNTVFIGDVLEGLKMIPDNEIATCVTSPPYYGLRDYGVDGQIGLEETPEQYVQKLVQVFREVKRVLRDDGTLWLNLGDSYGSKQLLGIPWRVALALQADGWYLRQDIIWHKPNPMPESVTDRCTKSHEYIFLLSKSAKYYFDNEAIKEPCVYDDPRMYNEYEPIRPDRNYPGSAQRGGGPLNKAKGGQTAFRGQGHFRIGNGPANRDGRVMVDIGSGAFRNKRSVWTVTTKAFKGAHFATFPEDLIVPCIAAGSSEHGYCPKCGAVWVRDIDRSFVPQADVCSEKVNRGAGNTKPMDKSNSWQDYPRGTTKTSTKGWKSQCECNHEPIPGVVLDPFMGSGTTALVARRMNRNYKGCELNPAYTELRENRLNQLGFLK